MPFVLAEGATSWIAVEACSTIRLASMSEMKESEKITSYCGLLAGEEIGEGEVYLGICEQVIVYAEHGLTCERYGSCQ